MASEAKGAAAATRPEAPVPLVSVVLPFLDEARFLDDAVETVRAQTLTDWELLLVDDGSVDGSSEMAARHAAADPARVRAITHPGRQTRGLPASRNLGLAAARGTFVAFLDADDRWHPEKLARQVDALQSAPAVAMTCGASWYQRLGADARPVRMPVVELPPVTFGTGRFARALVRRRVTSPVPSDVLYRTATLRAVGGVPRGDNLYEDQRTYVAVSLRGPVLVTGETLSTYTLRDDSLYGSLSHDAATKRENRRRFERWVVAIGLRSGRHGLVLAALVVARRAKAAVGRVRRAAARPAG